MLNAGSSTTASRDLAPKSFVYCRRGGKAASAFWNVNGVVRFGCAQRGKVIASFELDDAEDHELPARLRAIVDENRSPG